MSSVIEVSGKLDSFAAELDMLSKALAETERKLEPLEGIWEEFVDDFELDLVEEAEKRGERPPPEKLRETRARRAVPKDVAGPYRALLAKRRRLEKRIKHLGAQIDAQRSILSALKSELEAVG